TRIWRSRKGGKRAAGGFPPNEPCAAKTHRLAWWTRFGPERRSSAPVVAPGPQISGIDSDAKVRARLPQYRFLDEPLVEATHKEAAGGIAESLAGIPQLGVRHAPGWGWRSLGAAGVVERELGDVVLDDVLGLCGLEPLESLPVAVNDLQPVANFGEPEVEVRHLPGELVPVEGDEPG